MSKNDVIVIGNSPNVFEKELGSYIDNNFEFIVRINDFKVNGFEKFIGSKTHIASYSLSPENKINSDDLYGLSYIWCCRPEETKRLQIADQKIGDEELISNIQFISKKCWKLGVEIVKNHPRQQPSSGLATLLMAREKFVGREIYYYGFDRETNKKHYFDSNFHDLGIVGHDFGIEMNYIESNFKCLSM